MITFSIQCGLEFPNAYQFVRKIHYLIIQVHYIPFSFCESPRNDIIACRRRSRCLRWSFRFILSTFVGHVEGFLILHSQEKRKIKTPNNFFQSLQSLREYYFLDITIKLAEISRTFSNQHGGLNSLIPVAMALFLLSHQSPYVRCVIVTPGIVTPTTAEK